jgi:16S rRNA pseudouridine516 synthase
MKIRLDRFFKDTYLITKKESIQKIKSGKVRINGEIILKSNFLVNIGTDLVEYKKQKIVYKQFTYFILNKPKNYVCANSDNVYKTVFDIFNPNLNLNNFFVVGRLDKDTTGLVVITNDGK